MTERAPLTTLRKARDARGYSRAQVVRLLEPPITEKTLKRWEDDPAPLIGKRWRVEQLASIYQTTPGALLSNGRAA